MAGSGVDRSWAAFSTSTRQQLETAGQAPRPRSGTRHDQALPADSRIRNDPLFTKLRGHRKIDHLNVVTSNLPPQLSNASDFSRSSIEARIRAGYQDAMQQGIGDVDAPGLRFGVTAHDVEQVGVPG